MKIPLVSIVCITYNHEKYIRNCLDGFVMQKTTFPFEILIHDDASTDNTANIIKDYEKKYADLIHPIYQTINQYSKKINPGIDYLLPIAKGKYIALCEGDDYWTDSAKLQKQVDFLEANSEYSICFHDVEIVMQDPNTEKTAQDYVIIHNQNRDSFTFEDLVLLGNLMHTPSIVFRKQPMENYPFSQALTSDYFLSLHNSYFGKIRKIEGTMAAYRVHEGGVFSTKAKWDINKHIDMCQRQIGSFKMLKKHYCHTPEIQKKVKRQILNLQNKLRFDYLQNNETDKSRNVAKKMLLPTLTSFNLKQILSVLINIFACKYLQNRCKVSQSNIL